MFLDCLEMIFDSLEIVIASLDVPLFYVGTVDISFWELILGLFVVGIIFGFFLSPRAGSVLQAASIENSKKNADTKRKFNDSYQAYEQRRFRNEQFNNRYLGEMGADF